MKPAAFPPFWRVALGFLVAPGVAALAFASVSPFYEGLPSMTDRIVRSAEAVSFVVYPMAAIFGVPTYLCLRGRLQPSIGNCVFAGSLVAALPWLLALTLVTGDEESVGNVVMVHNHVRTLAGWMEVLKMVGGIAALGAIAGLTFWLLAAADFSGRQRSA